MIRDIAERNPRFKSTLGTVTISNNTFIKWNDVQVIIRNVSASGNRLSPDYYMCTQRGRAILAKVADKEGQLVEWVKETDKTRLTPEAGVYYVNVDFFDDQTREIGLTCQMFKWIEGKIKDAQGSLIYFRPGIDITTIQMFDALSVSPPLSPPINSVQFIGYNQSMGAFAYLLSPVQQVACSYIGGQLLIPNVDFWYERLESTVICQATLGGQEILSIPHPYVSVTFTDQDGYQLRQGVDFTFYGHNFIQLAVWSPQGSTITANAVIKLDPSLADAINPENLLQIPLQPNESLQQLFVHTTAGDFAGVVPDINGMATIPTLLQPGEWARWEARIETPQTKTFAKKWELNSLVIIDPMTIGYAKPNPEGVLQPLTAQVVGTLTPDQLQGVVQTSAGQPLLTDGIQQFFVPGLVLAIGDQVVVGDQVAILVSPTLTETYEVFGSKENISFTLEVKANDLQTASDLSEMIKQQLLIMRRENTEADGLTIFEATRDYQGQARDLSGTASAYIYTISISASADWKVYVPLITRLVRFEIIEMETMPDFQGKLQLANRVNALGATQFIPSY